MKLQVTNIARDLTEEELRKMFEEFGEVLECTLVLDKESGKSKGFGFVKIANKEASKMAVKQVNGRSLNGVKVKVKAVAD